MANKPMTKRQVRKLMRQKHGFAAAPKGNVPAAIRRPMVNKLRLQGFSPQQISVQIGCHERDVHADLKILFAEVEKPQKQQERAVQAAQIDEMYTELSDISDPVEEEDDDPASIQDRLAAYRLKIQLLERKAKLHGLDEDKKVSIGGFNTSRQIYDAVTVEVEEGKALGFEDDAED